jgi:hypothetical protein
MPHPFFIASISETLDALHWPITLKYLPLVTDALGSPPDAIVSPGQRSSQSLRTWLSDVYSIQIDVDLRLRTLLYVIWLIDCWLRAALVNNFVNFNRAYDRQRALCEYLILTESWFELVEQTKARYGICDDDVHTFDEVGFTRNDSVREKRPKAVQLGYCEQVTLIAMITSAS